MNTILIKGESKRRNPIIADVLYKAGYIEKWGRGISEMISKCKLAGDPEPEFDVDETEFKVIFRFPKSLNPIIITENEKNIEVELSVRQKEILEILASGNNFN